MTHGRKPHKSRWAARPNTMLMAQLRATCLTPAEVAETMLQARHCFTRLREGVATEEQHVVLLSILRIAQGIEDTGIVKGLREHLASALQAMDAIYTRATATGTWCATPVQWHELDAITTAVDLHEFQLGHVSAGELHRITQRLINQTRSSGGTCMRVPAEAVGLAA